MYKVLIGKCLAPPPAGGCDDGQVEDPAAPPGQATLLQLPSPSSGAAQQFVLLPNGGGLAEVNRVRHEYGAWLVNDRLIADGSCFLCSPIDPVYVFLALLDKQQQHEQEALGGGDAGGGGGGGGAPTSMFQEASSLLCIDSWPGAAALEGLAGGALPLICDVKESGDDRYYRLSEARVGAWLRCKLEQTLEGLREAAPGSVAGLAPDGARAYALGFMVEYLSPRRLAQLSAMVALQPTGVNSTTPSVRQAPTAPVPAPGHPFDDASQQKDKARKLDPKEAARRKAEEGRAEAKAARMAKQAEGTRKISSFFTAGAKKK